MRRVVILFIRVYSKIISPFLGPNCRYHPTCSRYSAEAVQKYGVFKGGWLGLKRILRCHPWSKHNFDDPVP